MKNSPVIKRPLYTDLNKAKYTFILLIITITFSSQAQNTRYGSGVGNGGDKNSFYGAASGRDNRSGSYNAYIGYASGRNNIAGGKNTFLGYGSGTDSRGSGNIFIGFHSGYGERGSNKLHIHNNNVRDPLIWGDFASRLMSVNGKLGIGVMNPKGDLQLTNKTKNRKIVLWQDGDNDHSFYGFGVNASTLRYQSSYHHVFYSNVDNTSSKEVFRINNDGKIVIGQSQLNSITNGASIMLNITGGLATGIIDANKVEIGNSQLSSSTDAANTMLTVSGGVKTDKVILNIGSFPDYVFADEYPLMPIEEVAAYITKNKHLPNIPSEKEIVASGLDVSQISTKLVEKIEELTLYTIVQQKDIKAQKETNTAQQILLTSQQELIKNQQVMINKLAQRLEKLEKSK